MEKDETQRLLCPSCICFSCECPDFFSSSSLQLLAVCILPAYLMGDEQVCAELSSNLHFVL